LRAADATLKRWRIAMSEWGDAIDLKFDSEINNLLMNELELPKVILRLRSIEKDSAMGAQDKRAIFLYADQVLALDLNREIEAEDSVEISAEAKALLEAREAARAAGDWSQSDRLRDQLLAVGIEVSDSKTGQSWTIRN
jgi:cysteinyl-tRNA synthetase